MHIVSCAVMPNLMVSLAVSWFRILPPQRSRLQGGIRVNLMPKMRQSLLNVTPRSQMMPNFTFPLHKYDSKKRLNRQQVLLRLAPTLVKVNELTPLCQEFSNSKDLQCGVHRFHPGPDGKVCSAHRRSSVHI